MSHVDRLIDELQNPAAYPHEAGDIVLHQTHISLVFLAGEFAYKIKKPVDFGFVDYSTLEARREFCEREVSLNRRLAADVYLGVVPVIERDGTLAIGGGDEEPVEWAVKMRRLDDDDTLGNRLADGRLPSGLLGRLGGHLAAFHREAVRGPDIAAYGRFDRVADNTLGNFEETRAHVGDVVRPEVHARVEALSREALSELEGVISERAEAGVPCDAHGDLRLEHVYVTNDGAITVVDCVEFNDAFRYADPVSDIAFLAMDLLIRGYDREAAVVLDAWFEGGDDREGRRLLDFYIAYRSCVRAKVHGFKAQAEEVPAAERESALARAGMHWRFALSVLAPAKERPRLVMVGGLPGTGKSTVARALKDRGWVDAVLRTDVVRKELAGLAPDESAADDYGKGIYSPEWTRKVYDECRERAEALLREGRSVAIDASFHDDGERADGVATARALGVQPVFLECRLSPEEAARRIGGRSGDASDANVGIHQRMQAAWDSPSEAVARVHRELDTSSSPREVADRALALLGEMPVVPVKVSEKIKDER